MKKGFTSTIVVMLIMVLFSSSCQQPKELVFKEYNGLTVDQLSFAGAALKVNLVYYNPNNFGLQLNRTDLDIYVDSTFLGHSSQDIQIAIPKRDNFTIPLKVDLDLKNLLKNGITSLFNKEVAIRLVGTVKVGKAGIYKSFPVDYTSKQNFSVFN
ncbi:LEA type 2 family protein [Ferruginibacter yonginensis]|uniref:LEA type 2 family protein n=1 Tax=Ferruginibacter yonginensis TaxID=1310416 RepID=A0ABV8QM57_9BACT